MGMEQKVFPSEILAILEREGQATRKEISSEIGCSIETVSRKVATLIKDGENIGFDRSGLFLQNAEDVDNVESVDQMKKWTNRIYNTLMIWAKRGNNQKAVAIEARKRIAGELSKEERAKLKDELLLITRVIDATNLDEELQG